MGAAKRRARRFRADREYDAAGQADGAWFASHPGRETRIRHATEGELEFQRLRGINVPPLRPGVRWFCIVRQIMPGLRNRVFLSWYACEETDVSEDTAAEVYLKARSNAEACFEADVRREFTPNGRSVH